MLSDDARRLVDTRIAAGQQPLERYGVAGARRRVAEGDLALCAGAQPTASDITKRRIVLSDRVAITHFAAPGAKAAAPTIIYAHGGGWVLGELGAHELLYRRLVAATGWSLVSIDYRLAPEHPFPAALDDCVEAVEWLHSAAALEHGLGPSRVVLAGDSAGGTLAAAVAARCPTLCFEAWLLIYPALDQHRHYASYDLDMPGMTVTGRTMDWFRNCYFAANADRTSVLASPIDRAIAASQPPCLLITAGYDPLCDEGQAYVAQCHAAGIDCEHAHYDGELHGFMTTGPDFCATRSAIECMARFLHHLPASDRGA